MEITERQLLALTQRADEMHHQAMKTFTDAARPLSTGAAAVSIRGAVVALEATPDLTTDGDIAAFAASVENTLVAAYGIGAKKLSGAVLTIVQTFAQHHQDHARAFNASAGARGIGSMTNPRLTAVFDPQFTNAVDEKAVLELAFSSENTAAATYANALDNLMGTKMLQLTASILPVESEHAVVLGTLLGKDLKKALIPGSVQSKDGYLDAARYPVTARP